MRTKLTSIIRVVAMFHGPEVIPVRPRCDIICTNKLYKGAMKPAVKASRISKPSIGHAKNQTGPRSPISTCLFPAVFSWTPVPSRAMNADFTGQSQSSDSFRTRSQAPQNVKNLLWTRKIDEVELGSSKEAC